jgi:hypothetical protein
MIPLHTSMAWLLVYSLISSPLSFLFFIIWLWLSFDQETQTNHKKSSLIKHGIRNETSVITVINDLQKTNFLSFFPSFLSFSLSLFCSLSPPSSSLLSFSLFLPPFFLFCFFPSFLSFFAFIFPIPRYFLISLFCFPFLSFLTSYCWSALDLSLGLFAVFTRSLSDLIKDHLCMSTS